MSSIQMQIDTELENQLSPLMTVITLLAAEREF